VLEDRFVAFIDILGFGALVEQSESDEFLQEKIFTALNSIQTDNINDELYARVNTEIVPLEELKAVQEIAKVFANAAKLANPVLITYFSDSLVISAKSNDVIASQLVVDIVGKLNIKMWMDHQILIRGGIAKGKLFHVEGGPLFGPAMNRAYFLESKKAKYPRVIIDSLCYQEYKKVETFNLLESLFNEDDDFKFISLISSLNHAVTDSTLVLAGDKVLEPFEKEIVNAPNKLKEIESTHNDERIKEKYNWFSVHDKKLSSTLFTIKALVLRARAQ
jgi:hypothetical protein